MPEGKPKVDPRMEYFEDYGEKVKTPTKVGTSKNIRGSYGSVEKI